MRISMFAAAAALLASVVGPAGLEAQQVYWIDANYSLPTLNRAQPNGAGLVTLGLATWSLPEGLALDLVHGDLVWTEAAFVGARVRRAEPNFVGFSVPTSLVTGGSAFRGIAAGASGPMVWTTSNVVTGATVRRANLDGTGQSVVVALGAAANPRGIAYLASPQYVFVANQDGIYRYTLAGAGGLLVSVPGTRPYGIAVNDAAGTIYWTEYQTGRIMRATTGGLGVTVLLSGLANPTYIALDVPANKMYWVEGGIGAQGVRRANLDGTGFENLTGLPMTTYGGIAVLSAGLVSTPVTPRAELALAPVSPNPAAGDVRFDFSLPSAQHARLSVVDLQGREVAMVTDGTLEPGPHAFVWNASHVRSGGVYFARLLTQGVTLTRRFTVLR